MDDPIGELAALFERFPGIGSRQAGRFVQHLLRSSPSYRKRLLDAIKQLGGAVKECRECFRFFAEQGETCSICANPLREKLALAVVATDADLSALERSHTFRGRYFVLGGTLLLSSDQIKGIRMQQLLLSLPERINEGLREVILALPANPEGDATADRVREELSSFPQLKITSLGRGLSTGSELEYADPETIRSALDNRR